MNKSQRRRRTEAGVVLLMFTVAIFVLFGFMGLALDASFMYFQKRRIQTAADSGAYAGALEKLRGNSSGLTTAVQKDTSLNGFTNAVNGVTVTVNSPPTTGPKAGLSDFVEVIVAQPQATWFLQVLNITSASVQARAVAGLGSTANGCVYTLNRDTSNSNNGFFINGTANSNFSCGVYSNANFRSVGGACVVTPTVSFTGTYSNHNGSGECGPQGMVQGVPVVDPLLGRFSTPATTPCTYTHQVKITGGTTVYLDPGVYCGGISIGGSVTSVVFNPGTYVLAGGGLSVNGSANISGAGVTFFNTYPAGQINKYDSVSINGSGTVNLSAPTSGANAGLLVYQDPTVSWSSSNGSTMAGSPSSVYDGIIYFPTTDLTYSGNSSATAGGTDGYTMLIGYNVKINGSANVNTDFSALGGKSPLQDAVFAE